MIQKLLGIRFVFLVAVFFTLLNTIVILVLGIREAIVGYQALYDSFNGNHKEGIGLYFLHSLDLFLIALVFLILSLGILKIFVHYKKDHVNLPPWLNIQTFKELKVLLWETILLTLVVLSFGIIVEKRDHLDWTIYHVPW